MQARRGPCAGYVGVGVSGGVGGRGVGMNAESLRGSISGKAVVVGNSSSLNVLDLSKIACKTISCNRILRHPTFKPDYLLMSDREAYIQERDAGRLLLYATEGGNLLLSETIFDPNIIGRRADKDKTREYPAQPKPDFPYYAWRVGAWNVKPNAETFDELICSCANICGPMLQAAAILGAKEIGVVGVDLQWPSEGDSHFFGDGSEVGAFRFVSVPTVKGLLRKVRGELETMGIYVWNLSPVRNTPFGKVFNYKTYEEFVQG